MLGGVTAPSAPEFHRRTGTYTRPPGTSHATQLDPRSSLPSRFEDENVTQIAGGLVGPPRRDSWSHEEAELSPPPNRALFASALGQRESRRPHWLRVHAPTRTQVSAPYARSVSQIATCATDPARGAHLREWSLREPCSSAQGGAGASWIRANADRPLGREAAATRPGVSPLPSRDGSSAELAARTGLVACAFAPEARVADRGARTIPFVVRRPCGGRAQWRRRDRGDGFAHGRSEATHRAARSAEAAGVFRRHVRRDHVSGAARSTISMPRSASCRRTVMRASSVKSGAQDSSRSSLPRPSPACRSPSRTPSPI
jgi:hypothetical protein